MMEELGWGNGDWGEGIWGIADDELWEVVSVSQVEVCTDVPPDHWISIVTTTTVFKERDIDV